MKTVTGHRPTPPAPKPCPQCRELTCGPISCRWTGIQHGKARRTPPLSPDGVVLAVCILAFIAEQGLTFAGVIAP